MQRRETPGGNPQIAFNPYEMTSIIPQLQEQNERDKVTNRRFKEGLDTNMETIRRTAEAQEAVGRRFGAEVDQLAKFSQTLTNYLVEEEKKKNQAEMEAGIADAYTNGIPIEQEVELEQAEEELAADDQATQAAGAEALEQTGNYETSQRVAGLSGWRQYGRTIGRAQIAGEEYGAWIEDQLYGMNFGSNAEAQAAIAELRAQYMRENGLSGANVAVLNKYAFPQMRRGENKALRSVMQSIAGEQSFNDQQEAKTAFQADKDLGSLISRLKKTLGADGKPLGNKGAHKMAKEYLTESIKAGTIDLDEARSLKNQTVPWDSKGRTFGELYSTLIDGAIREAVRVDRADAKLEQELAVEAADENVREIVSRVMENPGDYTLTDIEKFQEEYTRATQGKTSTALDELARNYNSTVQDRKAQRATLLQLQAEYRLMPYHLKGVDPSVAREFTTAAQANANARKGSQGGSYTASLNSIKSMVKKGRGDQDMGENQITPINQMIVLELQNRFLSKVQEFLNTGMLAADAEKAALMDVNNYFENEGGTLAIGKENGRYHTNAERDNYKQIITSNQSSAASKIKELASIEQQIRAGGNTKILKEKPGLVLSKEDLEGMDETYGTPDFEIPPMVKYLGDRLGLDPFDIINAQRDAFDMEPLESKSWEAKNQMSEKGQRLLDRFRSQNRSQRAFAMQPTVGFNPDTVQHGALYQAAGQKYGIDPGLIAAMGEIESGHGSYGVSYNGSSFGVMQIHRASHPEYFARNDWRDPAANIDYGAQYFAGLIEDYGGDIEAAAMAYNAGPGNYDTWKAGGRIDSAVEAEMINHGKKFMKAYSRYQRSALKSPATMRGQFEVRQIVSTDVRYQGDDDPKTLYDPAGHGGDHMHQHYEFATLEQANLARAMYEARGFRVTSQWRKWDIGSAHQYGVAIDVAPPLNLPRTVEAETEWIDKANAVIGL